MIFGIFLVLLLTAIVLFNAPHIRTCAPGEKIQKLEAQGLVQSQPYRAVRAFQVEEFEDEGSHYFLKLDDHRVVFLSGQYLWNYDSEDHPRAFPCTEFVVRRHATKGYALDVLCNGTVIEPELISPPFNVDDFGTSAIPEDGQIIRDKRYESIKDEFGSRSRASLP